MKKVTLPKFKFYNMRTKELKSFINDLAERMNDVSNERFPTPIPFNFGEKIMDRALMEFNKRARKSNGIVTVGEQLSNKAKNTHPAGTKPKKKAYTNPVWESMKAG